MAVKQQVRLLSFENINLSLGRPPRERRAGRQVLLPPGARERGLRCTLQSEDPQYHAAQQVQVSGTFT